MARATPRSDRALARIIATVTLALTLVAGVSAASLDESLGELVRAAREYRAALVRVLEFRERDLARSAAEVDRLRDLAGRGIVARRDVAEAQRSLERAQAVAEETRSAIGHADATAAEAQARQELAKLPPPAPGHERDTPSHVEHAGVRPWTLGDSGAIERFFSERFGRSLPVSAFGQTRLHDRLGFDHQNALDVAIHPERVEGQALLAYLRAQGVPFLAFRGARDGDATGAHVHIGDPSPRRG